MTDFASRLITWQKIHGRHDLPWQNTTDPYAIWVSEIMLQQTQVTAVIGYYAKFMARFPTISALANATQDEVLQHWSGLGYYSRARNLHHAAQTIVDEHDGVFPQDFDTIQTLSGIGRSTAAAIASFAFHQVQTILDGNVKRVLTRHFAISGWPSTPKVEKSLWLLAEKLLPQSDMVAYTQGLMDLGATICTRSKPKCTLCPLNDSCLAREQNLTSVLPTSKPKKSIPEKNTTMLILRQGNEVMLVKRPPTGIWGGLWSLPIIENDIEFDQICQSLKLISKTESMQILHSFTHFTWILTAQIFKVEAEEKEYLLSELDGEWLSPQKATQMGIPTAMKKLISAVDL